MSCIYLLNPEGLRERRAARIPAFALAEGGPNQGAQLMKAFFLFRPRPDAGVCGVFPRAGRFFAFCPQGGGRAGVLAEVYLIKASECFFRGHWEDG